MIEDTNQIAELNSDGKITLAIRHEDQLMFPATVDGIVWETNRQGSPAKLSFSVIQDEQLNFQEGDPVRFEYDGNKVFYGFVFTKKRNKNGIINVMAYDQLRYLKNKNTYVYKQKTATELIKMIAQDFNLQCGEMDDTAYIIEKRCEDNKTLFDIIQTALDLTLVAQKKLYVLYDNFGKIELKNIENMKLDLVIQDDTAENYNYESSIDKATYSRVRLYRKNKDTGKYDIYQAQSTESMNQWGVLQYTETIDENIDGKSKADNILLLYNSKTRSLSINNAFGDPRVRAGCSVIVNLALGDIDVKNSYLIVESARHKFEENQHLMELHLRSGEKDGGRFV
ncbi:MAG: hydrolase [Alphaproteobacteria bacterium]|nr:hydrolase [Alphaproteobacteria bacterium]